LNVSAVVTPLLLMVVTFAEHRFLPLVAMDVEVFPLDQLHLDVLRGLLLTQTAGQYLRGGAQPQGHRVRGLG